MDRREAPLAPIVWLEAERDIDPRGAIRNAVADGRVSRETLDDFVACEVANNLQLYCSAEQLRKYVLALLDEPWLELPV